MKQKLIIGLALLLLLGVVYLIARDLFTIPPGEQENPAEYDLEKLKIIDSTKVGYREIKQVQLSFKEVSALAMSETSTLYVAGDREIQVFDSLFQKKRIIKTDSSAACLAVYGDKVIVGIGGHIEIFSTLGERLEKWDPVSPKSYLTSVATNGSNVYVADAGNRLVYRYDLKGHLEGTIGKKDKSRGIDGFILPSRYFDLALSPDHELWAVNPGKHEIINFTEKGDYRTAWGVPSMQANGFAGCCNPTHFCFLPDGKFVTCEKGLDRIKIHDLSGNFECYVAMFTDANILSLNDGNTGARIHDVVANSMGDIFVLDGKLKQVRVFKKK